MKNLFLARGVAAVATTALLFLADFSGRAGLINWTNAASGGWNNATNWNPNTVPGAGDTALITNAGVTVSLNGATTVSAIILGTNGAGTVKLALAGQTLVLSGSLTVNPSGSFTLDSGALAGNGSISGTLNWTGGMFGPGNYALTIATNGTLVLAGTNGVNYLIEQVVTNAGIVRVQSGNVLLEYCGGGQYGSFINLPGALVDMKADVSLGSDGCGPGFVNGGTVRKSGGTGTNNITGAFLNTGTVDAQTGTISFNGSDGGSGWFVAETGATLAFGGGTFVLNGNLVSSNAVLAGATFSGNGSISGTLNWTGGTFGLGSGGLTIATNGTLVQAGTNGGNYLIAEAVTNAGIVRVQGGNVQIDYCGSGVFGSFVNLPGALVDMKADVSLGSDGCSPGLVNGGTVRKSGGTGTNNITGAFLNTGTVDAQTGTISFNGSDGGSGWFAAETGATLAFGGGTFVLNGNLISSNAVLAGATFSGNGSISGTLNWTGGTFGLGNGGLTIATNGTLVLAGTNGGNYLIAEAVTNAGIVRVQGGNVQIDYCGSGRYGSFVNLPGALVDMPADVSLGSDGCSPGLFNGGTVRKSGGTGTNNINGAFLNSGIIDAQIGNIALQGAYTLTNGTQLNFGLGGSAGNGSISLSGAAAFAGSLSVNLNGWLYWPAAGSTFNLLNYTSESGVLFTNATLPAFITWQTNYQPAVFSLAVMARATNPAPTSLSLTALTNTSLSFAWPGDHTGWTLQSQTNPPKAGLTTNWSAVPGSALTNQIVIPIIKTNGSVFFRLIDP